MSAPPSPAWLSLRMSAPPWAPQVADAAEYVLADEGGDLLLVPVFEGSQQVGVLLQRFRVRPAGLRPAGEGPPQQPHEQEQHRRAGALIDTKVKAPVQLSEPAVIRV